MSHPYYTKNGSESKHFVILILRKVFHRLLFDAKSCYYIFDRKGFRADFLMQGGVRVSESIGSKLRSLRKAKGYSQRYVAERVHMKRSTISNYEIGRRLPSLTDLKRIADFFGVGLDYFDLSPTDSVEELLARARDVFASPEVSIEAKDALYKEIAMLYFKLK